MRLEWGEIFYQGEGIDFHNLIKEWTSLLIGSIQPIGMSAFGDIYFLRSDGSVCVLDVLEGEVRDAALTQTEFAEKMNCPEWLEDNLMPEVVWQLRSRGLVCGRGQVYGFAPHPALAGRIDAGTAMVFDSAVWNAICSQTVG